MINMKANEAPEKIYLVNDDLSIEREWYKTKQVGFETIEYTRTDAFIEKAWDWIEDNLLSSNQQDKSHLYLEQFKKHMKGE
jgi:hypothetical protein